MMRRLMVGPALNTLDNSSNNFNSPSTTPTRPPRSARLALQPRDQNAMMRITPKSPLQSGSGNDNICSSNSSGSNNNNNNKHSNRKMPHPDRPPSRPLMLSAAAQKASNRTPFTPRVAGSVPPTNSTPIQPARPRSENKTPVGSREDIPTPVSTFLNHNITPRSGPRKSRVDSTNSTPTGTPNGASTPQLANEPFRIAPDSPHLSGLGIGGTDRDTLRRPTVSFSPAVSDVGSTRGGAVQPKPADSKFFFASDAKAIQSQPPRPPPSQPKNSTFFYANGDTIPPPPQSSSVSAVGSTMGEERSHPKFFHANGIPDLQASPSPQFPPPRPSSAVSSSSRMISPRLANGTPGSLSPTPRPVSPSKFGSNSSVPLLKSAPLLPSPVISRPQTLGRGQSANGIVPARRASIEVQKITGHNRSASNGSEGKWPPSGTLSAGSIDEIITPISPTNLSASIPVSTPEDISEESASVEDAPTSSTTGGNSLEKLNALAANARRERKVLDLEITNSSLAAINRTLEREMRKQTAELRRYRRLSRSGRLSITTSASLRTSTGTLSIIDGEENRLMDLSEEEEESEEEDSELEDSSSNSSSVDGTLSPIAMAASDLRHRKRDERRLQLDLSKHQQLLVDSQNMNQSLKRCLGWTEELISEGKKALDYRVRVSDIELGGRVLVGDDGDVDDDNENEGMSDIEVSFLRDDGTTTYGSGNEIERRQSDIAIEPSHFG